MSEQDDPLVQCPGSIPNVSASSDLCCEKTDPASLVYHGDGHLSFGHRS